MPVYVYEIKVQANSPEEATRKINAACTFLDVFNLNEQERIANILRNQPDKLKLIRGYIS
jgi:hypothetical protein